MPAAVAGLFEAVNGAPPAPVVAVDGLNVTAVQGVPPTVMPPDAEGVVLMKLVAGPAP